MLYLELGSTWENIYKESFKGKLRDELLKRETSYPLEEMQILIKLWRLCLVLYSSMLEFLLRPPRTIR